MPLPDNAEENIALLPYWICGYDLDAREWKQFSIWDLKPLEYDEEAWGNLIMDDNTKDLIRALVDSTGRSLDTSVPMRVNKGKNVLLSGPPGTGKMTTVHAVSNLLKKPLVTISSADFWYGTDQIAFVMSLAVAWKAIIVVEAADTYLQATYKDRVNATLRQLEGDDCVSFWVTSSCNEELLRSFCAVINFPELNATARRRLWLSHFGQSEPAECRPNNEHTLVSSSFGDPKKMDYATHLRHIEKLSRHRLDGKMIENIVRSARALAESNGEHLSVHHINVVMKAQQLDKAPLWRKLTRILMFSAKVLHTAGVN